MTRTEMTATKQQPATDPIDLLVPPLQPWWLRLMVGVVIVGGVGFVGFLWQYGHIRPSPDCCGSGSSASAMALSADGQAVTITARLFNSSGADIVVTGAQATLEGAEVLSIGTVDPNLFTYPIPTIGSFPVAASAQKDAEVVITFVPQQCSRAKPGSGWGWVTLDLETPDSWYPTFGRSYRLSEPMVTAGDRGDFSVYAPPGRDDAENTDDPLLAACRLLGR